MITLNVILYLFYCFICLGVAFSLPGIVNIFIALVKVYHPDINKNIKAEIEMKEVNNYWDIIEKTDLNKWDKGGFKNGRKSYR